MAESVGLGHPPAVILDRQSGIERSINHESRHVEDPARPFEADEFDNGLVNEQPQQQLDVEPE